jgi:hypothetical protein
MLHAVEKRVDETTAGEAARGEGNDYQLAQEQ